MSEKYSADKDKEGLKELAVYLNSELYRSIYNEVRTYLVSSGAFKNTRLSDGISLDDAISIKTFRLIEDYVFNPLSAVFIYYEEPLDCVRWLKGIMKSIEEGFSDKVLTCWLSVLQNKRVFGSERESYAQIIINELSAFDYEQSDVTPLAPNTSWIHFFTGGSAFRGNTSDPVKEVLTADFAIRGLISTPEEILAKQIRKDPVTAYKVTNDLFPSIHIQAPSKIQTSTIDELERERFDIDNTTARQVLVIHYLLKFAQVRNIDAAVIARLVRFLTGKNEKNIYDAVRSPLASKTGNFRVKDLRAIRPIFDELGLSEIVKMIDNEIDKPSG